MSSTRFVSGLSSAGDRAVAAGGYGPITIDSTTGRLRVDAVIAGGGGSTTVVGNHTPSDSYVNPTDAVNVFALGGAWDFRNNDWGRIRAQAPGSPTLFAQPAESLETNSYLHVYNTTGGWQAATTIASYAAAVVNPATPMLATGAFLYAEDTSGGVARRVTMAATGELQVIGTGSPGDTLANPGTAVPTVAYAEIWNGTSWDRARGDANKNLLVQVGAPENSADSVPSVSTAVAVGKGTIKASAGNLLSITVGIGAEGEIPLYLCLVNKASNPANGDTALWTEILVPITGNDSTLGSSMYKPVQLARELFSEAGIRFSTGVAWCISTTPGTVTLVSDDADMCVNATYV